jgi:hypothetical protein
VFDDVTCDAAMESERQPGALDTGGDTDGICAACYLILDEDMTKESLLDEYTFSNVTIDLQ